MFADAVLHPKLLLEALKIPFAEPDPARAPVAESFVQAKSPWVLGEGIKPDRAMAQGQCALFCELHQQLGESLAFHSWMDHEPVHDGSGTLGGSATALLRIQGPGTRSARAIRQGLHHGEPRMLCRC